MSTEDLLYELFSDMPRQGPGSNEETRRAWAALTGLPPAPAILDVGCGSGTQTLELARLSHGRITALDSHQPFLDRLDRAAAKAGLAQHIRIVNASMLAMPFEHEAFDIIWSEGAIFVIGFEAGLRQWRPLLKPGGYLVVSEMTWLRPNAPEPVVEYFRNEYPAMTDAAANLQVAIRAGYRPLTHFSLPEHGWRDNYYVPLQERVLRFKSKHVGQPEAAAFTDAMQREIDMYAAYSDWYGYVFYLLQKPLQD